ncbi:MAG TPA: DUF177 domain-containing protein [bacterium]|nr:DUF177 domain-containing protein [bacterium]
MLRLDIGSLPEGHSHQNLSEDASDLDIVFEGGRAVSPVAVSLDIDKSGDEIFLAGRATVNIQLECARCLSEYPCVLGAPFQMVIVVGEPPGASDRREDELYVPSGSKYVELGDEVRSELLVRLPLKPLCKKDCRGLCPTCGTNLNGATCACETAHGDSRWDALKRLRKDA